MSIRVSDDHPASEPATYLDGNFQATHSLSPVVVHLFATFERLDREALQQAHAALFSQVPVLGSNLLADRWVPADINPDAQLAFIDLRELGAADAAGLERLTSRFIRHDPEPGRAPQLKSVLVRLNDRDALAMQLQHTAMDGVGFRDLLYLLADNYNQARQKTPLRAPESRSPLEALQSVVRNLQPAEIQKARTVQRRDKRRQQVGGRVLQLGAEVTGAPGFLTMKLGPELLAGLKRSAGPDEHLNDQLLATMALAMARTPGAVNGPLARLGLAVDLRRYLDRRAPVYGNFSATTNIEISVARNTDIKTAIAHTTEEMAYVKENSPGLAQLISLPSLSMMPMLQNRHLRWAYQFGLSLGLSGPVLTNVGPIDQARCRFDGVPALTVNGTSAIPRNGYGLMACVTGYNGSVTIQVPHMNGSVTQSQRRSFAQNWATLICNHAGESRLLSTVLTNSVFN